MADPKGHKGQIPQPLDPGSFVGSQNLSDLYTPGNFKIYYMKEGVLPSHVSRFGLPPSIRLVLYSVFDKICHNNIKKPRSSCREGW